MKQMNKNYLQKSSLPAQVHYLKSSSVQPNQFSSYLKQAVQQETPVGSISKKVTKHHSSLQTTKPHNVSFSHNQTAFVADTEQNQSVRVQMESQVPSSQSNSDTIPSSQRSPDHLLDAQQGSPLPQQSGGKASSSIEQREISRVSFEPPCQQNSKCGSNKYHHKSSLIYDNTSDVQPEVKVRGESSQNTVATQIVFGSTFKQPLNVHVTRLSGSKPQKKPMMSLLKAGACQLASTTKNASALKHNRFSVSELVPSSFVSASKDLKDSRLMNSNRSELVIQPPQPSQSVIQKPKQSYNATPQAQINLKTTTHHTKTLSAAAIGPQIRKLKLESKPSTASIDDFRHKLASAKLSHMQQITQSAQQLKRATKAKQIKLKRSETTHSTHGHNQSVATKQQESVCDQYLARCHKQPLLEEDSPHNNKAVSLLNDHQFTTAQPKKSQTILVPSHHLAKAAADEYLAKKSASIQKHNSVEKPEQPQRVYPSTETKSMHPVSRLKLETPVPLEITAKEKYSKTFHVPESHQKQSVGKQPPDGSKMTRQQSQKQIVKEPKWTSSTKNQTGGVLLSEVFKLQAPQQILNLRATPNSGQLSARYSKLKNSKKAQAILPKTHILARRISLTTFKKKDEPRSLTSQSEKQWVREKTPQQFLIAPEINSFDQNRFSTNSAASSSTLNKNKFASSLVGSTPSTTKQQTSGEKQTSLKAFAKSLLNSASNSVKVFNFNSALTDTKIGSKKVKPSGTKSPQAIQLVSVKYQNPKQSLIVPPDASTLSGATSTGKAKSFVLVSLQRSSPSPGALMLASSNLNSVNESSVKRHNESQVTQQPQNKVKAFAPPEQSQQTKKVMRKPEKKPSSHIDAPKETQKYAVAPPLVSSKKQLAKPPSTNVQYNAKMKASIKPTSKLQTPSGKKQPRESARIQTPLSQLTEIQNLTPRARIIAKLQKRIKQSFAKFGEAPETQLENYKIGKVMGKGAFGKVNLAIHRLSGKFVALKSINKQFMTEESSKRKVMQEFNILRRTRQANIVRLYESFETPQHIVFVMEVCGGGDLLTYVRRRRKLKEEIACHIFRQVIEGLQYCHSKSILHRDIKLDNILLTSQGTVKICDFGVSKLIERPGELMFEQCGTPAYIAPEVFENKGYVNYQSDLWSAGVVLYTMLYGTVPFKAQSMLDLHKQVVKGEPDYKEGSSECVSSLALSLLKSILEKDPLKRLKPDQILDHPWMQQFCTKKSHKVNVFSQTEKDNIMTEFQSYTRKKERVIHDNDCSEDFASDRMVTDPFAEQLLVSTQNSGLKNISSRSIVLAPFTSTLSDETLIAEQRELMNKLLAPKRVIRFTNAKLREIDRQYELNNNAELDNGVYHMDEQEQKSQCKSVRNTDKTCQDDLQLESQLGELMQIPSISDGDDLRDPSAFENTEWQQLQQEMIEDYEEVQIELINDDATAEPTPQNAGHPKDREVRAKIEECGYPKAYLLECLQAEKLNHVTTFYHLAKTKYEY